MLDWIGWVATAVFAGSYLCKEPAQLRRVQAVAAVLWLAYGVAIHAMPVIVANGIVAAVALVSSRGKRGSGLHSVEAREGSLPHSHEHTAPSLRSG